MRHDHAVSKCRWMLPAWLALGVIAAGGSEGAAAQMLPSAKTPASASDQSCPRVALNAVGRADAGNDGKLVVSLPNGDQRYAPQGRVPVRSLANCHAYYAIRVERLAGKCWLDLRQVKTVGELEERLARRPKSCPAVQPKYLGPSGSSRDTPIRRIWPAPRFDPDTVSKIGVVVDRAPCVLSLPPIVGKSVAQAREALKSPCMTIDTVIWANSMPTAAAQDDATVVSVSPDPGFQLANDHGNPRVILGITPGPSPTPSRDPGPSPTSGTNTNTIEVPVPFPVPGPTSPIPPALVGGGTVLAAQALARRRRRRRGTARPMGTGGAVTGRVRVRDDIPGKPGE